MFDIKPDDSWYLHPLLPPTTASCHAATPHRGHPRSWWFIL